MKEQHLILGGLVLLLLLAKKKPVATPPAPPVRPAPRQLPAAARPALSGLYSVHIVI